MTTKPYLLNVKLTSNTDLNCTRNCGDLSEWQVLGMVGQHHAIVDLVDL